MIFLTISRHNGIRLAELGALLVAIAGVAILLGGLLPFGRKPGEAVGGLLLLAGGLLLVIATHWGHFG